MLSVRAPATSANLGSGYDVFGVALSHPADIVTVERADETTIEVVGAGSQYIPEDPDQNTVGAVADALDATARIHIDKGVRPASGLGSSAASAAAAALALNELYDRSYSRRELIAVAAEGEAVVAGDGHNDNVAPALLGGFTIAAGPITRIDASIPLVVCLPELVVSTSDARKVVPETTTVDAMVETVGRAATLTAGMASDDPTLVGCGMDDSVVTPQRAALIDGYDRAREAAFEAGATGVTVSGSGPGIVAACYPGRRRAIASAMVEAFESGGIDCRAYQTRVGAGATVLDRSRSLEANESSG